MTENHVSATNTSTAASGGEAKKQSSNKAYHLRSMISFALFLFFVMLLVTGVVLYISPRGRVANWVQWTFWGLTKDQWTSVHTNAAILFILASLIHLLYNWKVFWSYLFSKVSSGLHRGRELVTAVVLALVVFAGSYFELPPFQTVMDLNMDIKNYWEAKSQNAPIPHAEELKMGLFAQQIGVSPPQIRKVLEDAGYQPEPGMTLKEIAEQKGAAPSELLDLINEKIPESQRKANPMRMGSQKSRDQKSGMRQGQGRGMGRGGMGPGGGQGEGRGMGGNRGQGGGEGRNSEEISNPE